MVSKKKVHHRCLRRKGHKQLAVRGLVAVLHAVLSLVLAVTGVDEAHTWLMGLCQFVASVSLFAQLRTALDVCFVIRAISSFGKVFLSAHLSVCGRLWPDEGCDTRPWTFNDARTSFRILHALAAIRFLLNGMSLMIQFAAPSLRTKPFRGHDELRRRSYIRAAGIPLNLCRAVLKLLLLEETRYERTSQEISINFIRALILIPISAMSLYAQWLTPPSRFATSSAAAKNDEDALQAPVVRTDLPMAHAYIAATGPRRPSLKRSLSSTAGENLKASVEQAAAAEEIIHMEAEDRPRHRRMKQENSSKKRPSFPQQVMSRLSSLSAFAPPSDEKYQFVDIENCKQPTRDEEKREGAQRQRDTYDLPSPPTSANSAPSDEALLLNSTSLLRSSLSNSSHSSADTIAPASNQPISQQ